MTQLKKEYIIVSILPIMMLVYAIVTDNFINIFNGLINIVKSNSLLVSDYFVIGGISAAFLNASIITLLNIYLMYKMKLKLNGLLISCIFLMSSFGLMGKNILNIIPFYIGAYIYSKYFKKPFKAVIYLAILASTLAPVVSVLPLSLSIIIGILIGFLMPIVTPHTLHFHSGYSLYNSGLAGGLLGILIYSIIKASGYTYTLNTEFYTYFNKQIYLFFFIYFLILIIIGILNQPNFFKTYKKVNMHTGRLVTDFVQRDGFYVSIFNMGLLGITCLLISVNFKLINGAILCSILTVVAFGGFGKHIKNVLPLLVGVILARHYFKIEVEDTIFLMTLFFATTLAPVAGKFGIFLGVIVGIIHYATSIQVGIIHGGLNLYNNGLAAGIVASIVVPIAESLYEKGLKFGHSKKENN